MNKFVVFIKSRTFTGIIIGAFAVALLAATFSAGAMVGSHKARFSFAWGDNYYKNFAGPRGGFLPGPRDLEFMEAHGIAGKILRVDGSVLLISGGNDRERTVLTSPDTIIKRLDKTVDVSTLQSGETLIIIGEPDDQGQVIAKFMRVVPEQTQEPGGIFIKFEQPLRR